MSFSLVLSGGGLKGLTHIGVLRALEERGLTPSLVVGVSMGALIGSAWAAGRRVRELEDRALSLERADVFRIAHMDMALRRMLAPAVYRREPLERIITLLAISVSQIGIQAELQLELPFGLPDEKHRPGTRQGAAER